MLPSQTQAEHLQVSGAVLGPGHKTDVVPTPGIHVLRKKSVMLVEIVIVLRTVL